MHICLLKNYADFKFEKFNLSYLLVPQSLT